MKMIVDKTTIIQNQEFEYWVYGWAKLDTLFNQKADGNRLDTGKNWTTFNTTD